jgi:hypothetical protein
MLARRDATLVAVRRSIARRTWNAPTVAYSCAIELARSLNHHVFDTLCHAVALSIPDAVLVTVDCRYFDKAQHLGQITWLADFA